MTIPQRFYRIARYKLAELKDRFDRLDAEAQEDWAAEQGRRREQSVADAYRELDGPLRDASAPPSRPSSTAPAEPSPRRTPDEIARGERARQEFTAPPASASAPTAESDPLLYHYRLLGVETGADFVSVQRAYNRLAARCDVSRFPAGSREEKEAQQIRERLESSFRILRDALDPTARRFDLLEFDDTPNAPGA